MFNKILIANRGEIAIRIIRACKELGVATVAIYSEADADSLHVRLADESICVGGPSNKDSYLNMPNILSAAMLTGSEAIHPGYAYFSEQPTFVDACESCDITFIGPSAASIELMGDKARAKQTAKGAGVPVIYGSEGIVSGEENIAAIARELGYPIRLKATAGGGGRGIRIVMDENELSSAIAMASNEAMNAFGNGDLYIEQEIINPRHIEIQLLGDTYGNYIHLGERECSVQRRNQKLLEESPSAIITPDIREKMGKAAIAMAQEVGYFSAGTIEFLLDAYNNFYFMEMNTRIQVEHPVTEMVTGIDIVKEQIRIASGEKLSVSQQDVLPNGHSIECRIVAEDPDNNFAPSPGTLNEFMVPGGPGVRVDTHAYAGYKIPPFYDAMIAKLIVWAPTRGEAIIRMNRALDEFIIEGVKTNIEYQKKIIANPHFIKGDITTDFIAKRM